MLFTLKKRKENYKYQKTTKHRDQTVNFENILFPHLHHLHQKHTINTHTLKTHTNTRIKTHTNTNTNTSPTAIYLFCLFPMLHRLNQDSESHDSSVLTIGGGVHRRSYLHAAGRTSGLPTP